MLNWLFILVTLMTPSLVWANDYATCGPKPGLIERLISDAEQIRLKCIDQIYEENQEKVRREVLALEAVRIKLDEEIKKTAIQMTISTVQCVPKARQTHSPHLVKRCQDAVKSKNEVISRIDKLMGWKKRYAKPTSTPTNQSVKDPSQFPCPSSAELERLKVARAFNARLNEMWTRCMIDG